MKRWMNLLLLLCVAGHLSAQSWIAVVSPSEQQTPVTEIVASDAQQFVCRVQIPGMYDTEVVRNGVTYHALALQPYQTLQKVGEPALPVVTLQVGVPYGKGYACEITDASWQEIPVGKVYPFQKPLLETEEEGSFVMTSSVYGQEEYIPDVYAFGEPMWWNGVKNVTLTVCPFRYEPLSGNLSVMKDFTVRVDFMESVDGGSDPVRKPEPDDGLLKAGLSNYNTGLVESYLPAARSGREADAAGQYDYLIVSMPDASILNSEALASFCTWKRLKGLRCRVVSTDATGTDCNSIRNYIRNEYAKGVKYVLFVGDHEDIPLYTKVCGSSYYSAKSDYWYGCMDGDDDIQADIAVGRFSVSSVTELENMIGKTRAYEEYPADGDWTTRALLVAHREQAPRKYQGCSEEIRATSYQVPFDFRKIYGADASLGGNNATNQTVIQAINAGANIVNYRGHGDKTSWPSAWSVGKGNLPFGSDQIAQLQANGRYPVVFSIACLNGDISYGGVCLMEAFTRKANGAVAFLGATESSYTDPNHTFDKYLFQIVGNDGVYRIGEVNNLAHARNLSHWSNSVIAVVNAFAYLWNGDPSLELWTGNISSFGNVSVGKSGTTVTVNTGGVAGCTITATTEDGAYFSSVENASAATFENVPSDCYISVDKHNYRPYVARVQDSGVVYVQNRTFTSTHTVTGEKIVAGEKVTTAQPQGKVVVKSGANVTMKASDTTTLEAGFECEKGGVLEIAPL